MSGNLDFDVQKAKDYWNGSRSLEAGRLIYDNLPSEARPRWATQVLQIVVHKSDLPLPFLKETLDLSMNSRKWYRAHRLFDRIRRAALQLDQIQEKRSWTKEEKLMSDMLGLAELACKVIYNASNPPDEFDSDSGYRLVSYLRYFVDIWEDKNFSDLAWSTLISEGSCAS